MKLRAYQEEALAGIEASLKRVRRTLFTQPTGTGKTIVFAHLIKRRKEEGRVDASRPAIILAHRDELLLQAIQKLGVVDPGLDEWQVGYEKAGSKAIEGIHSVIVASVQSVGPKNSTRLSSIKPSLIIIDEAHHASEDSKSYWNPLARWGALRPNSDVEVVGCTATPKRLDRKALVSEDGNAMFEEVAYEYPLIAAIKEGWLCQLRGYRVYTDTNLDAVGVKGQRGDFREGELETAVDTSPRTMAAFLRWKQIASDRQTIVFTVGVSHAVHAAEVWTAGGFTAEAVSGEMSAQARQAVMGRFRTGVTQVLTNCNIATEGFDVPSVACIVQLRPTKSWSLYVQMTGRGTRIDEGKADCVVIDVVDNTTKHSLVNLPSMLDLPPTIDLEGRTLEQAYDIVERIVAKRGLKLLGGREALKPQSLTALETMMEEVDLLSLATTPPELEGKTKYRWLETPGGGYAISQLPNGISVRLSRNTLGLWVMTYSQNGRSWRYDARTDDLDRVLVRADKFVSERVPEAYQDWIKPKFGKKAPPTDKQLSMLRRLGYEPSKVPGLTLQQASDLITTLKERAG